MTKVAPVVLFLLKVPPPVHGSTLMNLQVLQSDYIRQELSPSYFTISLSKDMSDVGRLSFRKLKVLVGEYFRFRQTLRRVKPAMVYFAISPLGAAFMKDAIFYLLIRLRGIPVIFHHHGKGVRHHGEKSMLFRKLYRFVFLRNFHICLAKELVSDIAPYIEKEPFIVPNGIVDFGHLRTRDLNGTSRKLIYISNYTVSKGILDLIESLHILNKQGSDFRLSIIGKPYDLSEEDVRCYVKERNLENKIELVGPVYNEEKFKLLANHDLLIFPTYYQNETFGLVLIEAMQCGLPVISTHEGGIPSVVEDGVTGFLVNKQDPPSLAEKIRHFIDYPKAVQSMGELGRKRFEENFTLRNFEEGVVNAIRTTSQQLIK